MTILCIANKQRNYLISLWQLCTVYQNIIQQFYSQSIRSSGYSSSSNFIPPTFSKISTSVLQYSQKYQLFLFKKISIFFQNCSINLYCTHIHSTVHLYDNSVVYITHYVSLLTLFHRCKDSPALLLCSRNYKIPATWNHTHKICKFTFID